MNLRGLRWPALGTIIGLALAAPLMADGFVDPAALVNETAGKISRTLGERKAEFEARPELLEDVVRADLIPVLDIAYSARLILGRAGRDASPEQLDAFAHAMSEQLVSRYARGLLEYRDRDQIEVLPTRGELDERMTRVRTRVRLTNGRFIPVDYMFRLTETGWKAFDVIVEGISYVTTYRNQIMPEVQETGLDAVIQRLQRGELELENQS